MADLSNIKIYLSGGASQTNPYASLGGAISSTSIDSQTATLATAISGVTVEDARGNTVGTGTLTFTSLTSTLIWTPPSGSSGTAVDVSADGTYEIQGGNNGGSVIVTVVASSLPNTNVSSSTTIANIANNLWDNVSKDESEDGDTEYRCLYIKNTGADKARAFKLWISANTPGQDVVEIQVDPAGISGTATQPTKTITGATWAANVTTFTVTAHGYKAGDYVLVEGMNPSAYNGVYAIIAVPTANTFTVSDTPDPGAFVSGGTATCETTAPSGVTFNVNPVSEATAISVGDLLQNEYQAVWLKRTVPAGVTAATASNTLRLRFSCKL